MVWLLFASSGLQPGIFDGLSELVYLNLAGNLLSTLPVGLFANTTSLEILNFGLRRMPPGALMLRASAGDSLSSPAAVARLLRDLDIGDYLLQVWATGQDPVWQSPLAELPDGAFAGLTSLQWLMLDHLRALTSVAPGTFDDLEALTFLDLTGAVLFAIPDGLFLALQRLDILSLRGEAPVDQIESGSFKPNGREIGGDGDTSLSCRALRGLSALTRLVLAGNQLRRIPLGFFAGLTSLVALDLTDSAMWILDTGMFDELTALQTLILSANRITTAAAGWARANRALTWLYWGAGDVADRMNLTATISCGYPDGSCKTRKGDRISADENHVSIANQCILDLALTLTVFLGGCMRDVTNRRRRRALFTNACPVTTAHREAPFAMLWPHFAFRYQPWGLFCRLLDVSNDREQPQRYTHLQGLRRTACRPLPLERHPLASRQRIRSLRGDRGDRGAEAGDVGQRVRVLPRSNSAPGQQLCRGRERRVLASNRRANRHPHRLADKAGPHHVAIGLADHFGPHYVAIHR